MTSFVDVNELIINGSGFEDTLCISALSPLSPAVCSWKEISVDGSATIASHAKHVAFSLIFLGSIV